MRKSDPEQTIEMLPVSLGRAPNKAYRTREHLTEAEMAKLLDALKRNRHGHRDWLIGLMTYPPRPARQRGV